MNSDNSLILHPKYPRGAPSDGNLGRYMIGRNVPDSIFNGR
jgi:hypothetical protein